jgi:hypothetical protein
MCGLRSYWGIDFSVVVVVVVGGGGGVLIPKLQCVRMPIPVTFYRW